MNEEAATFLRDIVCLLPGVGQKLDVCRKHWLPEPPPTTVLFSEVGGAIAEQLDELADDVCLRVFSRIEEGMISVDAQLRTAVATGLVEAMVTSSDANRELWHKIRRWFGPCSLKHAEAWRGFGVVEGYRAQPPP